MTINENDLISAATIWTAIVAAIGIGIGYLIGRASRRRYKEMIITNLKEDIEALEDSNQMYRKDAVQCMNTLIELLKKQSK